MYGFITKEMSEALEEGNAEHIWNVQKLNVSCAEVEGVANLILSIPCYYNLISGALLNLIKNGMQ